MNLQQDLFKPLMAAYSRGEPLRNDQLYESLCTDKVIPGGALLERVQIGKDRALHNPVTRKIRWAQQGLRALGLLEKVPGERGVWRSTVKARDELTPAPRRTVLLGFSTKLGLALWGDCADVFTGFNEPIHCCLTSPPEGIRGSGRERVCGFHLQLHGAHCQKSRVWRDDCSEHFRRCFPKRSSCSLLDAGEGCDRHA